MNFTHVFFMRKERDYKNLKSLQAQRTYKVNKVGKVQSGSPLAGRQSITAFNSPFKKRRGEKGSCLGSAANFPRK